MTEQEKNMQQETIKRLAISAIRNHETAKQMLNHHHRDWSLFVFHLALEKLLKALVVQKEQTPPFTHNLRQLADVAELDLPAEQQDWLAQITGFNLETRYPEAKEDFYHKATAEFTATWHERCETIYLWLDQELKVRQKR